MTKSYIISDNIISALGFSTGENIEKISRNISGIQRIENSDFSPEGFYAALICDDIIDNQFNSLKTDKPYTRFEKIAILSITEATQKKQINLRSERTLFIIASTKGNINLLEHKYQGKFDEDRVFLWKAAQEITSFFRNPNKPIVISNACISGISAQVIAHRLLKTEKYDTIIVTGTDILSAFVVAGFQSFKALGSSACKPYDAERDGLSLGEASATIIISSDEKHITNNSVELIAGSMTNDANHISGPSRTGDGLFQAIRNTISNNTIDYICAHGTATPYNDEMEAKAFQLANLDATIINSLKGYFGHTLGAAGVIESVVGIESIRKGIIFKSLGYSNLGVSVPLKIANENMQINIKNCLKTASGFGGCNGAILFSKLSY